MDVLVGSHSAGMGNQRLLKSHRQSQLVWQAGIGVEHKLVDAISELLAKEVLHPVSNPAVGKFCIVQVAH